MKTKVLAALVATMAVGATCAFAANPFVDVPSDSWAYKSVVELADAFIIRLFSRIFYTVAFALVDVTDTSVTSEFYVADAVFQSAYANAEVVEFVSIFVRTAVC